MEADRFLKALRKSIKLYPSKDDSGDASFQESGNPFDGRDEDSGSGEL